jgi:peptidoglycan/xylan/chitin deacetylase (PgdA/CDA1 family)
MTSRSSEFWPNGARLCISMALQFEAGGQPISGAGGPITEPIEDGLPDLGTNSWFDYGVREGIPRVLDLFEKHGIRATSFMVAQAVDREPALARQIVERGHEAAAHGRQWAPQYTLCEGEERQLIIDCIESLQRATGTRPSGYDCYWMRGSVRTLSLLQELGFTYHNNDLNMDEPWLQDIAGKPFVSVPYTVHLNDIVSYDHVGFSPMAYEQQLKDEFDQLYEEGARRRRMMVVSLHDRLSGRPSRVKSLERFLIYAKGHPGVWFARKDEIAAYALTTPHVTPTIARELAEKGGLAANTAQRQSAR